MANTPRVETYNLVTRSGRHIRQATKVTLEDGYSVKFIEKLGKHAAITAARRHREFDRLVARDGMPSLDAIQERVEFFKKVAAASKELS
jgi:hydrogenase maturation factor